MANLPSILLIGCGHMGHAMLKGWLKKGLETSVIVHRHALELPSPHQHVQSIAEIPKAFKPKAIILAMKPAQAAEIIPSLAPWTKEAVILSVLGGRDLTWLKNQFGDQQPVVRVMPNTPSELGLGMTSVVAGPTVTDQQKQLADDLLHAVGEVAWLDSEKEMDVATAIAGCGPAYIFLLAELLQKVGEEKGLSTELARLLARQTVVGSAALLGNSSQESEALRKAVATPGGITERAVNVLIDSKAWPDSLSKAIQAAADRSKEMAS
ncbi:pyrroline-5-carboxylate reductase [Commensalibacter communis]|uniref:pyrroline-5-carboxylate reductase n=1 Tax=Commensalibacter communis TaxID=2972786 RepID=UPI0022FF5E68|nr:pyrroline-5-carboxylate reductase [Commensalibacter communis]CAI3951002.1 Pyrroline-5-carboxylate reductase (ProC) (PDB:3GT0) (PUBMED:22125496 [Commensalibacter communis]CAI3956474.1 Pyrroline-5-carboxylate reductase (ProC) (PDB:3GT0) (PUBMED:22125496 [Commensalibacter communis]